MPERIIFRPLAPLLVAASLALVAPLASAADACISSFLDVPTGSSYCSAAEWLKQRGVTVGCTDNVHYCPDLNVTRASMALFMKRLSDAMQPRFAHSAGAFTAAVQATSHVCVTTDFATGNYARVATAYASVSGKAGSNNAARLRLVYSTDQGASWQGLSATTAQYSTILNNYMFVTPVAGPTTFDAATVVRFGVELAVVGEMTAGQCDLTVRLDNYNAPP